MVSVEGDYNGRGDSDITKGKVDPPMLTRSTACLFIIL